MPDYLLGLDMGTGGCKAALIDDQGQVLSYAFREYPFINEKPGWSEHDPHLYWELVCELFKQVVEQAHADPRQIRGIGVSSALPALVMVDAQGQPLHRAYNLMDRRATREVQWVMDNVGEERVYRLTGYRLEDHPTMVNLLWEKNNRPETYRQIWKALTMSGFIILKLTGKTVINRSDATFFGAYDLRKNEFSLEILDQIGVERNLFPEVHSCEEIIGQVTCQAASECGLAEGIPVAAGQADACAGWVGAGAIEVGDFQSNLGTVGNFGIIHQDFDFVASHTGYLIGITCPYTLRDTLVTIPSTMTGGQSLRYLRDAISQAEIQVEQSLGISSYDLLNLEAAKVLSGSDGLIVLPLLMGERSPLWDVHARGVIFGLSLNHTKGHIVRAMMEGVAYAMYDSFSRIKDCGLKINYPMVLNEGGAVSRLWRQIITDVFNIPTALVKRRTGAPYGDGILAGVATGVFKDFTIAKQWAEYVEPLEPNSENHEIYMEYFTAYKQLYDHVKEDFQTLARLRARQQSEIKKG
jgi:xylulokinase